MSRILATGLVAFGLSAFTAMPVQAESFATEYDARISGIRIGRLTSVLSLKKKSYSISGSVRTAGLAAALAKFKGTISVKGWRNSKGVIVPSLYTADQTRKNDRQQISLGYKRGNIISIKLNPKQQPNTNRVPITAAHLKKARDPASALFLTVRKGSENNLKALCNRTIRIFDANERYDLKLSYLASKGHRPAGATGNVVTCAVRYVPVSGHIKGNSSIKRLANNKSMRISFAQLGKTNGYVVSELSLNVRFGKLVVKAR